MFDGEMILSFVMIAVVSAAFVAWGVIAGRREPADRSDSDIKKAA